MEELITAGAVTVGYETSWGGECVRLAVCADRYEWGGALALLVAIGAIYPGDEGECLELWCSLTVNLPGDPVATEWCSEESHVVLNANDVPAALVDALVGAGVVELAVRSGFCSYPLAAVPRDVLERLRGYEETVRSLASREG
ncbi:MAG: hypothetical protein Q4B91_01675 [Atopobiaceae bacterium]|nr:hypothetical protein [Atopobiaceae bacterium]